MQSGSRVLTQFALSLTPMLRPIRAPTDTNDECYDAATDINEGGLIIAASALNTTSHKPLCSHVCSSILHTQAGVRGRNRGSTQVNREASEEFPKIRLSLLCVGLSFVLLKYVWLLTDIFI